MTNPTTIPLARSFLCCDIDCSTVGDNPTACPICSSQTLALAAILNREVLPMSYFVEQKAPARDWEKRMHCWPSLDSARSAAMRFAGVPGEVCAFRVHKPHSDAPAQTVGRQ